MDNFSFGGFSTPTHTQAPQEFFDIILDKHVFYDESGKRMKITTGEIKVLSFLVRNTFGWQAKGTSLHFTFSDIQKETQMWRQAVNDAIKRCLYKGYIERMMSEDGQLYYRLTLAENDPNVQDWQFSFDWRDKKKLVYVKGEFKRFGNQTRNGLKIKPKKKPNLLICLNLIFL